jgi:glycosyltransferase involved in cell wall biosynthesis
MARAGDESTGPTGDGLDVSIVLPVYRNADTVLELHRRLCQVLEREKLRFEILFVEDACPRGSLGVLEALAERDSRVAVLALERNVGQHRAVLEGLAYARGKWTVVMDADLQDPPEAIPILLAKGQEGFAAVFAGRRGRYESRARLLTSRVFKGLLHLLCGTPKDAGIFVAMNQAMTERLLTMGGPAPFVGAMIGCAGLPMASIPVVRTERGVGNSAYSFGGRLTAGWRAIAWVLAWKWRRVAGRMSPSFEPRVRHGHAHSVSSRVTRHIGARFGSP